MSRADRVEELKKTVSEYVSKEKTRIENEVAMLEAILQGRTGSSKMQLDAVKYTTAVATNDLKTFLGK